MRIIPLFLLGLSLILFGIFQPRTKNVERKTQKEVLSQKTSPVPSPTPISAEKVLITKVVDGDTVDVLINGQKDIVRLIGINAPETTECFGKEATDRAREILNSKEVILEPDSSQDDRDKYHRLLRYVFLDGINFDEQMVKEGFAKEYTYKIPYKYQSQFKTAEQDAQNNKRRLWADGACANPTPTPFKKSSTPKSSSLPQGTPQSTNSDVTYSCNCSKLCSQIATCQEAYYQLNNCGCTKRDSDGDGIPCESLCK